MELPSYQSHKIVQAAKIEYVTPMNEEFVSGADVSGPVFLKLGWLGDEIVQADWFNKHKPEAGGYFVRYDDGYISYSPAEAFENGYKPIDPDILSKGLTTPVSADERVEGEYDVHSDTLTKSDDAGS